MMARLGIGEFLGCLIDHIEQRTGLRCHDFPDNEESPMYSVEVEGSAPENTKTMYVDVYSVTVHCISGPTEPYSNAPVLRLVRSLEEAMSEDVAVPEPFLLYRQEYEGLRALKRDETGEGHAVLAFKFWVCYGLRCK